MENSLVILQEFKCKLFIKPSSFTPFSPQIVETGAKTSIGHTVHGSVIHNIQRIETDPGSDTLICPPQVSVLY